MCKIDITAILFRHNFPEAFLHRECIIKFYNYETLYISKDLNGMSMVTSMIGLQNKHDVPKTSRDHMDPCITDMVKLSMDQMNQPQQHTLINYFLSNKSLQSFYPIPRTLQKIMWYEGSNDTGCPITKYKNNYVTKKLSLLDSRTQVS